MGLKVEADTLVVQIWDRGEYKGENDILEEEYGPFGSWDEAKAFAKGLQVDEEDFRIDIRVLRNPSISSKFPIRWSKM